MSKRSNPWRDKVALVTGGSSGIGLALSKLLAAQGARVWILARRQGLLDNAVAEISSHSGRPCGAISADVADPSQVREAVERINRETGAPDLVINSAGITYSGYFQELDLQIFHDLMEIDYFGTVNVVKACLPGMLARGSGYFVNISSLAGILGAYGYTAYSASKFAVCGFTEALRAEMKPYGIRFSIVLPPDTDTYQYEMDKKYRPPEASEVYSSAGLMKPEAVARSVLQGVEKGHYIITPGLEASFFYRLIVFGNLVGITNPVLDWLLGRARRKFGK